MQVIPVIDLMRGEVVRGLGGRRSEYRAIESILAADAKPVTVARAFVAAGFRTAYLADLDAIQGGQPALDVYAQLMRAGLHLWVDAGLKSSEQAQELSSFQVDGQGLPAIVAGLESLAGPDALSALCAVVGASRLVFSLDLKNGKPLAEGAWKNLTASQVAVIALRLAVRRMIVLDLAAVGMGGGAGTEPLCRALRSQDLSVQIVAGGGVRGERDLDVLAAAGCDAALVASALHDGRLDASACARMR